MEVQGFTNQKEYDKAWALTKPASPDTARKIAGFLNMVKDRADEKINNLQSTASPETQRRLTGIMSKVKEGAEKAKSEMESAKKIFFYLIWLYSSVNNCVTKASTSKNKI